MLKDKIHEVWEELAAQGFLFYDEGWVGLRFGDKSPRRIGKLYYKNETLTYWKRIDVKSHLYREANAICLNSVVVDVVAARKGVIVCETAMNRLTVEAETAKRCLQIKHDGFEFQRKVPLYLWKKEPKEGVA